MVCDHVFIGFFTCIYTQMKALLQLTNKKSSADAELFSFIWLMMNIL